MRRADSLQDRLFYARDEGLQRRYAPDLNPGLTQVLADGTNTYLYGNGRIAQQQSTMQYFGADGLGSVRQIYNSSGQIIANKRYDPYGNVLAQNGVGTSNYGFTGEWTDATGLEYLRARYYAPTQGRFTTRDVWEGDYNAPMSYNAWNYTRANPINLTDPSGTKTEKPPSGKFPRSGLCLEPGPERRSQGNNEFDVWKGDIYIYCGDFDLSAYQVIQDIGYDDLPMPPAPPGPPPSGIPSGMARGQIQGAGSFTVRAEFAADVRRNGSGQSDKVRCTGGYFSSMAVTESYTNNGYPRAFTAVCGVGRNINPATDAYRVAARDRTQMPEGAVLHIKRMVVPQPLRNPPSGTWVQSDTVTAMDTGERIRGYMLDIFVGQGRGERSFANYPEPPLNTWANRWAINQPSLRLPVYQRIPPGNALRSYYESGGLCDLIDMDGE